MRAYARTDVRIAYSVVTKYAAIAHQIQHSQVLPGYPHSSAGDYTHMLYYSLIKSSCSVHCKISGQHNNHKVAAQMIHYVNWGVSLIITCRLLGQPFFC